MINIFIKTALPCAPFSWQNYKLHRWFSTCGTCTPIVVCETFLGGTQWWIFGEANEAVASGSPHTARSLILLYKVFLEIITKLGRKVGNRRSIRSEDLFF